MKVALLLLLICSIGSGEYCGEVTETLTAGGQGSIWGEWDEQGPCKELCDPGTYVTGFRLKVLIYVIG